MQSSTPPETTAVRADEGAWREFFELARRQRAHRRLEPDPIEDSLLRKVLLAAIRAPSAENRQPWEFVVVQDPEIRSAIAVQVRDLWRSRARAISESRLSRQLFTEVDRWAEVDFATAPVLVVVCGNAQLTDSASLPASIFPAVQNLLLAATALGLGSLLSTLPTLATSGLQELLGLPGHVKAMAVVPLGWPARELSVARREPLESKLHFDRFGSTKREP